MVTNIHPNAGILQFCKLSMFYLAFYNENLALFMVTSIHSNWKTTKIKTRWKAKIPGLNRSKNREIELINKKSEGKEKVFNTRN